MSEELDQARRLVAAGEYKKAVKVLWRVEANARADLGEARGLREVASACGGQAGRRVRRDCEFFVESATASIGRLSRPRVDPEPPQHVEAAPAPLTPLPPIHERSTIVVVRAQSGAYDVRLGDSAVGRLTPTGRTLAFEDALAESIDDRWRLESQRHRSGWRGVVTNAANDEVVGAYYPRRMSGGALALVDHSYELTFRHLHSDWRLCDDDNVTLAKLAVRRSRGDKIEELEVKMETSFRAVPNFVLVLLLVGWAILLEAHLSPPG